MAFWSPDPVAEKDARLQSDIDRMMFVENRPQQDVLDYLNRENASPRQRQMLQQFVYNKAASMGMKAANPYPFHDTEAEDDWLHSPSRSPHSGLMKLDTFMRYSVWGAGLFLLVGFIIECCFAAGTMSAVAFHVIAFLMLILAIGLYIYAIVIVRRYNVRLLPDMLSSSKRS